MAISNPAGYPATLNPPWKKGQSGNGGRPPGGYRRVLKESRKLSMEALQTITKCMRNPEAPWAQRLHACEVILDRAWGAPRDHNDADALDRIASITLRIVSAENPDLARTVTIEREPEPDRPALTINTVPSGSADN